MDVFGEAAVKHGLARYSERNESSSHGSEELLDIPELSSDLQESALSIESTTTQDSNISIRNEQQVQKVTTETVPLGSGTLYASTASWSLPLHFEDILREGWLHKVGGLWPGSGGQRWFTASVGKLIYVRWPGDRRQPRTIPLGPLTRITLAEAGARGFAILISSNSSRDHRLEHANRHDAFEWMRAISLAASRGAERLRLV